MSAQVGARTAPPLAFGLLVAAGSIGTASVAPALPAIAADLGLSDALTAAVIACYAVPYATATILAGQLVDRFGPRRVLRVGAAGALVGVGLVATATGPAPLLVGRAVQGLMAQLVTITGYAVVRDRDDGIPTVAALLTVGSAVGPLLGGVMAQLVSWRAAAAVPLVPLPLGLVVRTGSQGGTSGTTDAGGVALVAGGATVVGIGLQSMAFLPAQAVLAVVLGGVGLAVAVRRSLRGHGSVPAASLLRDRRIRLMGAVAGAAAGTYFATIVVVPVRLGQAGWGPIAIGLLLLPPAVSGALTSRWSHLIARRLGRLTDPLAAVLVVVAVGVLLTSPPVIGAQVVVLLAGAYGMVQPRLMAAVAERLRTGPATALGTANLLLLLGGGLGAALVGGLGATPGLLVAAVLAAAVGVATARAAAGVSARSRSAPASRRTPPPPP